MGGGRHGMWVCFVDERTDGPEFMVGQDHFGHLLPLLSAREVFQIGVLENVSVSDHDIKAVIHDLSVTLTKHEIPDLVALQRKRQAVLRDPRGPGIS